MSNRLLTAAALSLTLVIPRPAESTPPPPPPPPAGKAAPAPPRTGALRDAVALARAGDHPGAARRFAAIARDAGAHEAREARLWLGKSLFRMGLFSASLATFSEVVAAGPGDAVARKALPWLAALARELPDATGVLEVMGTLPAGALEDPALDPVRGELYGLLGRVHYQRGDLEGAVALFGQVPRDSDDYVPSQYLAGVAETRAWHGPEAIEAFKNVLRHVIAERGALVKAGHDPRRIRRIARRLERLEAQGHARRRARYARRIRKRHGISSADVELFERNRRMEEMALLSIGYIFYQVGRFETGLKYFDRIPQDSPYWLDAVLASAWSEFGLVTTDPERANVHYQRTLGHLHTLDAPFFDERLYPEGPVLRAVTYYYNCRYGAARLAVEDFERRYSGLERGLEELLASAPEDFELYERAAEIRARKPRPYTVVASAGDGSTVAVEDVARNLLHDRDLDRRFRHVDQLMAEQRLLEDQDGAFRGDPLGVWVGEHLELAISMARETAGAEARRRIGTAVASIEKQAREATEVHFEILERIKHLPDYGEGERQRPRPDSEHEIYAYNGEYWRDELGYYYYRITSRCAEDGTVAKTDPRPRRTRRKRRVASDDIVVIQRQRFLKVQRQPADVARLSSER